MEYANFRIMLNVNEACSGAALTVKHGDNKRRIYIYLTEDDHPYPLRGDFIAVLRAKKSDGTILYNYCTIEKDAVIYDMTAQTTAAAGRVDCELRLYSAEGEQLTSSRFIILVDSALYPDETITSTNEATELQRLLADSKVLKDIVQNNWDSKVDKEDGKGLSSNDFTTELKNKLSGIEPGANKYEHPEHPAKSTGMYKVTVDGYGHVSYTTPVTKEDIVALGISAEGKEYEEATALESGLMSARDKAKLDQYDDVYFHPAQTVKIYNAGTDGTPSQTGEDLYFDETDGFFNLYAGQGVVLSEYTDPTNISRKGIRIQATAIPGEKGEPGERGKSVYEIYVENGGTLSESQWLASLSQTRPEFADDITGCTDTSKVYVLPDGYIYAYMTRHTVNNPNQLDPAKAALNVRFSGSGTVAYNGGFATDYIPVDLSAADPYIVRIEGLPAGWSDSWVTGSQKIAFYGADKSQIKTVYIRYQQTATGDSTKLQYQNGQYICQLGYTGDDNGNNPTATGVAGAKYVRFGLGVNSGTEMTREDIADIKIYFDPLHTDTYETAWMNTGLAFVPTDYEDRILAAENDIDSIEAKLETLETGGSGEILPPDYWMTAIGNKKNSIKTRQQSGRDTFQFVWFSDMHGVSGYVNPYGAGTSSQVNIGKVAQYLCNTFNIPLVAASGDMASQASHVSVQNVYTEYKNIRSILAPLPDEKLLAVRGNHDGSWGAPVNEVYYLKHIGAGEVYNEIYRRQAQDGQRVFGGDGTYFYVDSIPCRVRFIMLNSNTDGDGSNDASGNAVYNSQKVSVYGTEQLAWLGDVALHMPQGWTAVIMAHQPPDTSKDGTLLAGMIEAYNNREAYSGTVTIQHDYWGNSVSDNTYKTVTVDADFTEEEGEVAAFFHGHIHKDRIDMQTYAFPCISITTAGGDVRDESPVQRVPGTATETAMDVVTLDKAARGIYMTRIGAGADRSCSY